MKQRHWVGALVVTIGAGLVVRCGSSDDTFNPSDSSTGNDSTLPPGDGSTVDVPKFGGDGGTNDVTTQPVPVSSLTLEQVWFIAGEAVNGKKDFLIDFRPALDGGAPVVTCGPPVADSTGLEGSAVFTDPTTGNLLFYTDGINIFNGVDNNALANGTGINGQVSASEPALITPQYGSDGGSFYVFSVDYTDDSATTGSIYYSTIDLTQGAHGTVTQKNASLFTGNVGEALDMVPHTNNTDFWVLGYAGAGAVNAFLVSKGGVSTTPVTSQTGLTGTVLRSAINHSYDYDHVVLAINEGTSGTIATMQIDRSTGKLTNTKTIATGDLGFHASYSGDGTKLYYVRGIEGYSGAATQYDLNTNVETNLGGTNLAAGKLAVDGKLYFASYSNPYMAVVNNPNAAGAASNFVANGLFLGGCLCGWGVPNQTAAYLGYLTTGPVN